MRKAIVGIKRVVDPGVRVRVRLDGATIETDGVKMSMNPFDEIAMEEALLIKERGEVSEVVAVSIGNDDVQQQLRTALAMGADRAIHVRTAPGEEVCPLKVAKLFRKLIAEENPWIVLLGKQAIDGDNGQTGQMIAALWDRPQATFASGIAIAGDKAVVTREVDAGLEKIEIDLPAVITTDLRLNTPRYVKLPEIMKAKKKPLDVVDIQTLESREAPQNVVLKYQAPAQRSRGVLVQNASALVSELKARGLLQ